MSGPNTSILILIFALYGFFSRKCMDYTIYFGIGICLILIGSDICIRTTTHLRFHPINKAAVIVTHNFTMLWYAPPDWVNRKAYTIKNCEFTNCEISFDKKEINNSDLVLFHHTNMNIKSPMKTANQKWVFVSLESLHHTWGYYKAKAVDGQI